MSGEGTRCVEWPSKGQRRNVLGGWWAIGHCEGIVTGSWMFAQADVSTKLPLLRLRPSSRFVHEYHFSQPPRSLPHPHSSNGPTCYSPQAPALQYLVFKTAYREDPGGILRYHHIKKLPTAPKCGDCGMKLSGVRTSLLTLLFMRSAAYRII